MSDPRSENLFRPEALAERRAGRRLGPPVHLRDRTGDRLLALLVVLLVAGVLAVCLVPTGRGSVLDLVTGR